jgi:hypothetical protein
VYRFSEDARAAAFFAHCRFVQLQVWRLNQLKGQLALQMLSPLLSCAYHLPLCILVPVVLQLSQAHTDHKKLRDQYSAEILARNADLASLDAAEHRAAQLQAQLTAAQDASTEALEAQQRAAEQATASVAAAAAARAEAEGRCTRLQSALDAMNGQLRQVLEAQAGGVILSLESEYDGCSGGCIVYTNAVAVWMGVLSHPRVLLPAVCIIKPV